MTKVQVTDKPALLSFVIHMDLTKGMKIFGRMQETCLFSCGRVYNKKKIMKGIEGGSP